MALNYGPGILGTCENCNCTSCYVHPSTTEKECMYSLCKTLIFYCSCLKADFNSVKTEQFKRKRGRPWLQEDKKFNCRHLDFKGHFFLSVCLGI